MARSAGECHMPTYPRGRLRAVPSRKPGRRRTDIVNWVSGIAIGALGLLPTIGCVATDRCYEDWTLRTTRKAEVDDASQSAPGASESDKRLAVGMTKQEVRDVAGALIEETDDHVWSIKRQFSSCTPGIYPFFDSRRVYLYFDDADRLIAVNVRGRYSVYP